VWFEHLFGSHDILLPMHISALNDSQFVVLGVLALLARTTSCQVPISIPALSLCFLVFHPDGHASRRYPYYAVVALSSPPLALDIASAPVRVVAPTILVRALGRDFPSAVVCSRGRRIILSIVHEYYTAAIFLVSRAALSSSPSAVSA